MHSRDRMGGGWSAIIDPTEEGFGGETEAQTDPQIKFPDSEKTKVESVDPVVRAMLDRTDEALEPPPQVRAQSRSPKVAQRATPSPVITQSERSDPGRKLRLPLPGENRKSGPTEMSTPAPRISMPTLPADPASSGPTAPSPPINFSSEELVDKLSEGTAGKKAKASSFWVENREIVRASLIGIVLLGGALVYHFTRPPTVEDRGVIVLQQPVDPQQQQQQAQQAQQQKELAAQQQQQIQMQQQQQQAQRAREEETAKHSEAPKEPVKAATPMVTVVSNPPGAIVEINGDVLGKTPLILRSPKNMQELSITISLDGYKKWDQSVAANEAGHFTVNAKLEPKR